MWRDVGDGCLVGRGCLMVGVVVNRECGRVVEMSVVSKQRTFSVIVFGL